MSFSRFAAIGAALVAGVTLASCASSSAPFPSTGLNGQVNSFAGNTVGFLQGSPQLQLSLSAATLYIDGRFSGTFPFSGAATPDAFFNIPAGKHEFKLVTPFTLFAIPTFDQVLSLTAGTKYLVIAQGDAGFPPSTDIGLYIIPHYSANPGAVQFSFFNASPKNKTVANPTGAVDVYYNCFNCAAPVKFASGVIVGGHTSPVTSWKNNVSSVISGEYCFTAYVAGTTTPAGGVGTVPFGSDAFTDTGCSPGLNLSGGTDLDFGIIDAPGGPPAPVPPSIMGFFIDQNG